MNLIRGIIYELNSQRIWYIVDKYFIIYLNIRISNLFSSGDVITFKIILLNTITKVWLNIKLTDEDFKEVSNITDVEYYTINEKVVKYILNN